MSETYFEMYLKNKMDWWVDSIVSVVNLRISVLKPHCLRSNVFLLLPKYVNMHIKIAATT